MDLDEVTHGEPPVQVIGCLQYQLFLSPVFKVFKGKRRDKTHNIDAVHDNLFPYQMHLNFKFDVMRKCHRINLMDLKLIFRSYVF